MNPISRSLAIFTSKSSGSSDATEVPKIRDGLLLGGDGVCCREISASRFDFEDRGNMEDADLKPNLCPVFFGGSGGGWSSEFVLPVLFRACAVTALSWYFCLINLSMAESASSTSIGMGGRAF